MTPRDRRRERAKRELAHVAMKLYVEKGYAATTVEEIADAANYSSSTFFRMFRRKEDSVFLDLDERLDLASIDVAAAAGQGQWPIIRKALLHHATSWEADDPEFAAARVRLFFEEPELRSRYLQYCETWETHLAERILGSHRSGLVERANAFFAAGMILTAYKTAFRLQAESGGLLTGHLANTLALIEERNIVRDFLKPSSRVDV